MIKKFYFSLFIFILYSLSLFSQNSFFSMKEKEGFTSFFTNKEKIYIDSIETQLSYFRQANNITWFNKHEKDIALYIDAISNEGRMKNPTLWKNRTTLKLKVIFKVLEEISNEMNFTLPIDSFISNSSIITLPCMDERDLKTGEAYRVYKYENLSIECKEQYNSILYRNKRAAELKNKQAALASCKGYVIVKLFDIFTKPDQDDTITSLHDFETFVFPLFSELQNHKEVLQEEIKLILKGYQEQEEIENKKNIKPKH